MARGPQLSNKTVLVWLAIFVIAALALRIGGNVEASYDEETGRYLYSGNDPYYHDRTVNHIVENGESLLFDPAINFPEGGSNPNPPLYDWTTAVDAKVLELFGMEQAAAVSLALNLAVAFWGAITVIPVFLIGNELFGRRAGLWAAFFIAVSAPHIQRGVFGFADHDATTMFFITLAMFFALKGVKTLDRREYVPDWRHSSALLTGLKASFAHNKQAMLWSALAGTALSATALTWKGYPYVLAVLAVAVGLHLISDHLKNRDSTAVWAFYLLPLLMVTIIPLVYYGAFPEFMDTTILAGLYVLIGVFVVGGILVPTRDLPSIVVFPALIGAAIIGLILMLVVAPEVGATIFTGLGYFEQTKLYTTIAEAQRSELGRVAASFGFFSFLIAFGGLWHVIRKAWKGDGMNILMVSWAFVALFMAFAASRFVMNAAPVFAVLAGAIMPTFTAWLKPEEVRKRFRQMHGQNVVKAGFKSLNMRAFFGGLGVFMFFILPNAWIGVDAALPREFELDHGLADNDPETTERFGAFGIDFSVKSNGWLDALNGLAELDQDMPLEDRPGFIAWWDYGHWATNIGKHPTVADPFQNHYNLAGRFLASESEQEAMAWLTILLIQGDAETHNGLSSEMAAVLNSVDSSLIAIGDKGPQGSMNVLSAAVDLQGDEIFDLYDAVSGVDKTVGYFAVDQRMYPIDADRPGIFYAPAFLANKNPDDFLQYQYVGSGLSLDVIQYGIDAKGNSYRLEPAQFMTAGGIEYELFPGQGSTMALPKGQQPTEFNPGTAVQFTLSPTARFFDSMYATAFGHAQNGFTAGEGLTHWRVISDQDNAAVKLLAYYEGVEVSGTVRDDAGQPLQGMDVTFVDGFGATHDVATTDANGMYTVLAPFSVDGDLTLEVRNGRTVLANSTMYQFDRDDTAAVMGADLTVERSDISGVVYRDLDGDGVFGENDTVVAGAEISFGNPGQFTGADGRYSFMDIQPGSHNLMVIADGFTTINTTHILGAGEMATRDIALTPLPSEATFSLGAFQGERYGQIPFTVTNDDGFSRVLTTDDDGNAMTSLAPGRYNIDLSYTVTENEQQVTYTANWEGIVPFGGDDVSFDVVVTKA